MEEKKLSKEEKQKNRMVIKLIRVAVGLIIIGISIYVYIHYNFSDGAIKAGSVLLIVGIASIAVDSSTAINGGEESYVEDINEIDNEFYDKGYVSEDDDSRHHE